MNEYYDLLTVNFRKIFYSQALNFPPDLDFLNIDWQPVSVLAPLLPGNVENFHKY